MVLAGAPGSLPSAAWEPMVLQGVPKNRESSSATKILSGLSRVPWEWNGVSGSPGKFPS